MQSMMNCIEILKVRHPTVKSILKSLPKGQAPASEYGPCERCEKTGAACLNRLGVTACDNCTLQKHKCSKVAPMRAANRARREAAAVLRLRYQQDSQPTGM